MAKKVGKTQNVTKSNCRWEEVLEEFLFWKQAQGLSNETVKGYKETISCFFRRYGESWQTDSFKKSVLVHMSDDIKPATFNIRLIYIRGFLDWCIEEGYISENPLKGFRKKKAESRAVNIPEEIVKDLLTLPDQSTFSGLRDFALIVLTLDTGIRPKEALNLRVNDFDFKTFTVTIPSDEAKTRSCRHLPLLPATTEAVKRLINSRHPEWDKDTPVFCSNEGTPLNRHTWGDRMEMYSKQIGFKIRPYDLRHCFALYFLRNGGNVFALQKTLGHTDMSMTKRYISLTGQDLRDIHIKASPLNRVIPKKNQRLRNIKE